MRDQLSVIRDKRASDVSSSHIYKLGFDYAVSLLLPKALRAIGIVREKPCSCGARSMNVTGKQQLIYIQCDRCVELKKLEKLEID